MFVTLLLPIVVPYGEPCTFFNPKAKHCRRVEFFQWVQFIEDRYSQYQSVPLFMSEDIEE